MSYIMKEQDKWTHTLDGLFGAKIKCKILSRYKDRCWILAEGVGVPEEISIDDLTPIEVEKQWTHVVESTSMKCLILTKEPDKDGCYAILLSDGRYDVEHGAFLEELKDGEVQ